jgi:hypothetical protein
MIQNRSQKISNSWVPLKTFKKRVTFVFYLLRAGEPYSGAAQENTDHSDSHLKF